MTEMNAVSVSRGRSVFVWGLLAAVTGLIFLVYALASRTAGAGEFIMPLDDVYIHFQYAHVLASGHPFAYNPTLPATSGATSFLYPIVLAVGDWLGFHGLRLGAWAMGIGALALLGSAWLLFRWGKLFGASDKLALFVALNFMLSGAVSWHFMSGMETGLMMFLTLLALTLLAERRFTASIVALTLLALMRPEGGIMALLAVMALFWHERKQLSRSRQVILLLPILALGVQPVVNLLVTGSFVASGNQAKSLFATVPRDLSVIADHILNNFTRLLAETTGLKQARAGYYITIPVSILALWGLFANFEDKQRRWLSVLLVTWVLAVGLALSTLETAFWHFKRYQMPLIVLAFPLATLALSGKHALVAWERPTRYKIGYAVVVGMMLISTPYTAYTFLRAYVINTNAVYTQPLQMARWIDANTPQDAVIAVHDVGLLRYIGKRTTIDMVGLTTSGAAEAWRNGPGAVAEFLRTVEPHPDYIASYGLNHGFGLDYLARTSLYADELAAYPVTLDNRYNVALASNVQGIYRPDWTPFERAADVLQPSMLTYLAGFTLVDTVNVADLTSEHAHDYQWHAGERLPGFPTEALEQPYVDCVIVVCTVLDGGRRINGEESFTVAAHPDADMILVTRIHPQDAGTFDVFAAGTQVATRVIPSRPGQWLEVATLIPAANITGETLHIRIVPHVSGGHYMPYYHWAYQGNFAPNVESSPAAIFTPNGIELARYAYTVAENRLHVTLDWQNAGAAAGDYKVFVHVYEDVNAPPVAQADNRPLNGTLPPGNWLLGRIQDEIVIDLSSLAAGRYQLAIGMYDPATNVRLMPDGGDDVGRLFLGNIEIGE